MQERAATMDETWDLWAETTAVMKVVGWTVTTVVLKVDQLVD